jgi:hypothetical protein
VHLADSHGAQPSSGCLVATHTPVCCSTQGVSQPVQVFPLAFLWWVYVVSGVCALRYLSVPMFRCDSTATFGWSPTLALAALACSVFDWTWSGEHAVVNLRG